MPKNFDWDATLALVRWQRTRRGYESDAALLQRGISLLQPDDDLQFGPQSALARTERAFNLPWHRIVSEVLQFAVSVITKAKRDDDLRLDQMRQALQLLQLALNALTVNGDAQRATLPLNSCNLLLSALAETLEKMQHDKETLQTIKDVKFVLLHLFGLPNEGLTAVTANFLMYRPPTNVFTDFLKRTFTASFMSLVKLQRSSIGEEKMELETLYVDVMHASLFVFRDLQKTQTNKKKVFLAIAKTSLKDFVGFRHSLVTLQKRGVTGVEAVTALLDHVVEDALFDAEHICEFDGALDDKRLKKRQKAGEAKAASGYVSYQKNLFDEFLRLLSDQDFQLELKASIGGFFELLVRGFATRIRAAASNKIKDTKLDLKTSRKRAAIVIATTSTTYSPFKFWSELCAVAYSAFQQKAKKSDYLRVLVTLYNALFRALCECDIYRVTEDTEERTQFQTMEEIISSFLQVLKVEHGDEFFADTDQALEECEVVSSAVRCLPNLVNGCLVSIFELLGVRAEQNYPANKHVEGKTGVIVAASHALIDLIHAYDSMRLLDVFLKGAFAIQQGHEGLYKLFAIPSCESALRKAFIALPPGQTDVLWRLLVGQIASFESRDDDIRNARGMAVARLLFQTFVQEIHVLLIFDSVLNASIREQTFDQMFNKLEGDRFCTAMEQLLSISLLCMKAQGSKSKVDNEKTDRSTSHGAAGIIKLCVFWLRKTRASNETQGDNACEGRERVTRLVIEYVINCKCWEAILSAYIREAVSGESDGSAKRIVCDAGFYEISSLRNIASDSLTTLGKRLVDEVQHESSTSLELPRRFFSFLLEIPSGYLKPQECGRLLATALALYRAIRVSPDHASTKAEVCQSLLTRIQQHFRVIGVDLHKSRKTLAKVEEQLRSGASFIVSQLAVDNSVSVALVTEVLGHYLDIGDNAFVGELLNSVLDSKNGRGKVVDKIARKLKRAIIVVQALAAHRTTPNASKEEKKFIKDVVEIVSQAKVFETTHAPLSFDVLTALLKYQSILHKLARQYKNQQTKSMTIKFCNCS
ncbi:unnamed protein product [Peronospora destructor]|uniref:Nucleolar 27S pre-rRNA processing Urb2/Npa2 C-terminal domain-containing protein n=1 Tax=Peronospora destructor TaxID=86335 RepID=A0AAV0SYS3_9STRA|nr:unnamed protein product [Peronospora destructor]